MNNAAAHRAIKNFQKQLENGPQKALKKTTERIAKDLESRTKETFETESSPEGKPWKPKKVPDGRKTLHGKTGKLSKLWKAEAKANEATVTSGVDYAVYHQGERPMLPEDGEIPSGYAKEFEGIFVSEMEEIFK